MDLDLLDLYGQAGDWTSTKVVGAASQLDGPTTCDGWDVRTLLNHMLQTQRYFVGATRGEDVSLAGGTAPDVLSDEPPADFARAQAERSRRSANPASSTRPALHWPSPSAISSCTGGISPCPPDRSRPCPTVCPMRPTP